MLTYVALANLAVALVLIVLVVWILLRLRRPEGVDLSPLVREELRAARDEAARHARDLREEVAGQQVQAQSLLVGTLETLGKSQAERLDELAVATRLAGGEVRDEIALLVARTEDKISEIRAATEARLEAVRDTLEQKLAAGDQAQERRNEAVTRRVVELTDSNREVLGAQQEGLRAQVQELQASQGQHSEALRATLEEKLRQGLEEQRRHLGEVITAIGTFDKGHREEQEKSRNLLDAKLGQVQEGGQRGLEAIRQTVDERLRQGNEEQRTQLGNVVTALGALEKRHASEQERARTLLDQKFLQIQESNEKKLEEMRVTVDEKLHRTLEARLGESFKLVSDRLDAVHKGLGEMQGLANGVGDLKRVLTNVKDRGTWGEYQLAAILEQLLAPDQFGRNVRPKGGGEVVEFAIRLPGQRQDHDKPVWLPIDAKFPKDDYERLVDAAQAADAAGVEAAKRGLLGALQRSAKEIQAKYISPPETTDFAIMFLPTEGLYAEALRQPGFADELQRTHHVLIAGPTTLSAILTSLRVGFQTLAIEKRAHEIWDVLRAVKTEFGKFGEVLERVKKQLATASGTLDQTAVRSRAMERRLKTVESLPAGEALEVLGLPPIGVGDGEEAEGREPGLEPRRSPRAAVAEKEEPETLEGEETSREVGSR